MTSTGDHSATAHRLFYSDNSGNVTELAFGTNGQVLTSTGATTAPAFQSISAGGVSFFEKTVGSGGDYATVGAAISAGFKRLLVISNTTESGNISLPDNTYIMGVSKETTISMGTNTFITGVAYEDRYTFQNLTIAHTNSIGGSLWDDNATNTAFITLTDVILDNNATSGDVDSIGNRSSATRNSFIINNVLIRGNRGYFVSFVTNGTVTSYFQANNLIIEGEGTSAFFLFDDSVSNSTNNIAINNCIVRGTFSTTPDSMLYGGVHSNWTISGTNSMEIAADSGSVLSNFQFTRNTPALRLLTAVQLNGLYMSNVLYIDANNNNVSNIQVSGLNLASNVAYNNTTNFRCSGPFTVNGGANNNNFINGNITGSCTLVFTEHSNNFWNVISTTGETPNKVVQIMRNTSGSSISEGSLVRLKSTANMREIEPCTTANDPKFIGTVEQTVANNAYVGVVVKGKTTRMKVNGTTDIAIGDWIQTTTTSGIGAKCTSGLACAIALEAYTSDNDNGIIDALIIDPRVI